MQSKFGEDWGQTWFWIGLINNMEWQTLVVYCRKGVLRVKDKCELKYHESTHWKKKIRH